MSSGKHLQITNERCRTKAQKCRRDEWFRMQSFEWWSHLNMNDDHHHGSFDWIQNVPDNSSFHSSLLSSHHLFSRYILIMPMSPPSECLHPLLSCIRGEAVTIPSILYSWFMGGYSRHQQCRFHSNEDISSEPNRKDVMSWESSSPSSRRPLEK